MPTNSFDLSFTEEAFLLSSLQEVVRIWDRGTGHASFNLQVKDGTADLQLNFQLGRPSDLHVAQPNPADPPHHQHQGEHGQEHQHRHHRRHKGPARRAKDRVRAANYQAQLHSLSGCGTRPMKPRHSPPSATREYIDVNIAKKKLFTGHIKSSAPTPTSSTSTSLTGFQRREEQLWTKLFDNKQEL